MSVIDIINAIEEGNAAKVLVLTTEELSARARDAAEELYEAKKTSLKEADDEDDKSEDKDDKSDEDEDDKSEDKDDKSDEDDKSEDKDDKSDEDED